MTRPTYIAVDFDGTLSLNGNFPFTGTPNIRLMNKLKNLHAQGNVVIIIWTCRAEDGHLLMVEQFLHDHGFDIYKYINNNPEVPFVCSRKIFADIYIDDRAIHVDDLDKIESFDQVPFAL